MRAPSNLPPGVTDADIEAQVGADRPTNDGGPAFPNGGPAFPATSWTEDGDFLGENQGMTLRDYFAAKAMHAALITDTVPGPACDALLKAADRAGRDPVAQIAFNAYDMADAMLQERARC